jgi:flagellar P-ring protein precursor FlgI
MPSVERSRRVGPAGPSAAAARRWRALACAALLSVGAPAVHAQRLKDIASFSGVRSNQLIGYGLVVGLDGTGDQTTQAPFTRQAVASMLSALGVALPPGQQFQLRNTAAAVVTATLPPFARPGQAIDITVSSLGNARSLRGGTLLMTPLRAADGQVYAIAQGSVVVSGAGASTGGVGGASTVINHLSAGRVPNGGQVERAVPQSIEEAHLQLELARGDFATMQRVVEAIGRRFGPTVAMPLDARALQIRVPAEPDRRLAFLAEIEQLRIDPVPEAARVVVNSRTGSVVLNQAVQLGPCAVAHGNLTVRVTRDPIVSQPQPFGRGDTAVLSRDSVDVEQAGGQLVGIPAGASLEVVVRALNLLGANPMDLIAILQAMRAAGALRAELEVI